MVVVGKSSPSHHLSTSMALTGAALTKYNAQFQRSSNSPLADVTAAPRLELDGAQVLHKYSSGGSPPTEMSGAEFYAVIGHLKRQHGPKGEALEMELMKISRQKDKKIRLADWISEHYAQPPPAAEAAPPPMSPAMPQMPRLDLATAAAAPPVARPNTARPDYNTGSQMADLLGSPRAAPHNNGSMTARPSTAAAAPHMPPAHVPAPVADMSVIFASFCSGRDHLKMTGAEYHSLIAWLKSKGHSDLEDQLMKVRLLGDKKFQLTKYMREKCSDLLPATAGGPITQEHYETPGLPPPAAPTAPVQMGHAEVLEVHHPPPPLPAAVAPAAPMAMSAPAPGAPVAPAGPGGLTANEPVLQAITTLEGTIGRHVAAHNALRRGPPYCRPRVWPTITRRGSHATFGCRTAC